MRCVHREEAVVVALCTPRKFDTAQRKFDTAQRKFDPAQRKFDPAQRKFALP